jgi:transposase
MLIADRGYDADWIRELAVKKGAWANIPPKSNRSDPLCFSPYLYRARNRVERFSNRIKQCRQVATRYDNWQRTISLSFSLPRSGYGFVLVSPRPSSAPPASPWSARSRSP